jgi:hypothetical protein
MGIQVTQSRVHLGLKEQDFFEILGQSIVKPDVQPSPSSLYHFSEGIFG